MFIFPCVEQYSVPCLTVEKCQILLPLLEGLLVSGHHGVFMMGTLTTLVMQVSGQTAVQVPL